MLRIYGSLPQKCRIWILKESHFSPLSPPHQRRNAPRRDSNEGAARRAEWREPPLQMSPCSRAGRSGEVRSPLSPRALRERAKPRCSGKAAFIESRSLGQSRTSTSPPRGIFQDALPEERRAWGTGHRRVCTHTRACAHAQSHTCTRTPMHTHAHTHASAPRSLALSSPWCALTHGAQLPRGGNTCPRCPDISDGYRQDPCLFPRDSASTSTPRKGPDLLLRSSHGEALAAGPGFPLQGPSGLDGKEKPLLQPVLTFSVNAAHGQA